jgi:hypothetical protein
LWLRTQPRRTQSPRSLVPHLPPQGDGIEGAGEAKWIHPPATGGRTPRHRRPQGLRPLAEFRIDGPRSISGGSVNGYRARTRRQPRGSRAPVIRVSSLRPACSRKSA